MRNITIRKILNFLQTVSSKFWKIYVTYNVFSLKLFLKFKLKLIWFFLETRTGYAIYVFSTLYGITGLSTDHNGVLKAYLMLFVFYLIGYTLLWFIFVKTPFTKKFLINLLGEDYIISHLGKFTGSSALTKCLVVVSPVLAGATAEIATKHLDHLHIRTTAKEQLQINLDTYGSDITLQQKKESLKHYNKMMETRPTGIVTRAIDGETTKSIWQSVQRVFTGK